MLLFSRVLVITAAAAELFVVAFIVVIRGVISIVLLYMSFLSFWKHFEHYGTIWMNEPKQLSIQIINKTNGTRRNKRKTRKLHSK